MKKTAYTLLVILILCSISVLRAQHLELTNHFNLHSEQGITVRDIHPNPNGSIYVTGSFYETVDFDPGSGVHELFGGEPFGDSFDYLGQYSQEGEMLWVITLPLSIESVEQAADGSLYVLGEFFDNIDADPGPEQVNYSNQGLGDVLVLHLSANGEYLDSFAFQAESWIKPRDIRLSSEGNLFILGEHGENFDMDPSSGTQIVTTPNSTESYLFFGLYSTAGELIGGFSLGTYTIWDMDFDSAGNIYLAGYFQDPIDLDPGLGEFMLTTEGGIDGFWGKYDSDLNFIAGAGYDGGIRHVEIDPQDGFCVAGKIPDSMDVDLGPEVEMLYSEEEFDIWYACYSAELDLLHARALESSGICAEEDMLLDESAHLFLGGYYRNDFDSDPDALGGEHLGFGGRDGYVAGYDASGQQLFSHAFADSLHQHIRVLRAADDGALWVGGEYQASIDLEMGPEQDVISTQGRGLFIARYEDSMASSLSESAFDFPLHRINAYQVELDLSARSLETKIEVHSLEGRLLFQERLQAGRVHLISLPEAIPGILVFLLENEHGRSVKKLEMGF